MFLRAKFRISLHAGAIVMRRVFVVISENGEPCGELDSGTHGKCISKART